MSNGRVTLTQAQTIALVAEHEIQSNRHAAAGVRALVRADVGELAARLYFVGPVCAYVVSVALFPDVQISSPKLEP